MPPKRVLIVDDSMELGRVLRAALETLPTPPVVRVVPSAEEAILDLSRSPIDLLIADVRLPGMTGFELVRKMRNLPTSKSMKVMMITGWTEYGLEDEARKVQADVFMRKPLNMGEFLDKVTELLGIGKPEPIPPPSLPPTQPIRPPQTAQLDSLSGLLAGLRIQLGAQAVGLISERGHLKAQAGELPNGDFEEKWSSILMSTISASAHVSRQLNEEQSDALPRSALAFKGPNYDLLLAPVGDFALVLFFRADRSALRLPLAVEEIFHAQQDLASILTEMGVTVTAQPMPQPASVSELVESVEEAAPKAEPEPAPEPEANPVEVAELEELLKSSGKPAETKDVDAFWEKAANTSTPDLAGPDVLTYEQARRLGLAPEDEENYGGV